MLDTIENSVKGNDNFTIRLISTKTVEGKSSIFEKNM